jgi:uncharacterized protein YjbI with pentapeptide repeats
MIMGDWDDAILTRAHLSDANISGPIHFDGATLQEAVIENTLFSTDWDSPTRGCPNRQENYFRLLKAKSDILETCADCHEVGPILGGANLSGAYLTDSEFDGVDLTLTDLRVAQLIRMVWRNVVQVSAAELEDANLSGASLREIDFSYMKSTPSWFVDADLTGAKFEWIDLGSDVHFDGATLDGASFLGSTFSGTSFINATMNGVNIADTKGFATARLDGATFTASYVFGCDCAGVDLRGSDFSGHKVFVTDFSGANLQHVSFEGADLTRSKFTGASMQYARLDKAKLFLTDFSGANLTGANLSETEFDTTPGVFTNAVLRDANLVRARWPGVNLSGVDLSGADVSGADWSGARLDGADLSGANLTGVNLFASFMSGATLVETTLTDANLGYADIQDSNFERAFLYGADLTNSRLGTSNFSYAGFQGANLTNADYRDTVRKFAAVSRSTTLGVAFDEWEYRGGILDR